MKTCNEDRRGNRVCLLLVGVVAVAVSGAVAGEAKAWSGWQSGDPMDDSVRKGIASMWTPPMRMMGFPYSDVKAVSGISCDGRGAYLSFTDTPNISDDTNHSGYSESKLRVRFDKENPQRRSFTQVWGSNQLHTDSVAVRQGILRKHTMMVEIPWHGEGNVIFKFDLTGSHDAYKLACADRVAREAAGTAKRLKAQREAVAKAKAEREKRAALEAERLARIQRLVDDPKEAGRHIESKGWACPSVVSTRNSDAAWYVEVICEGNMQYLIRASNLSVVEMRRSGKRL